MTKLIPLLDYFSERDAITFFGARSEQEIRQIRDMLDGMNDEEILQFKSALRSVEHLRDVEAKLWTLRN